MPLAIFSLWLANHFAIGSGKAPANGLKLFFHNAAKKFQRQTDRLLLEFEEKGFFFSSQCFRHNHSPVGKW